MTGIVRSLAVALLVAVAGCDAPSPPAQAEKESEAASSARSPASPSESSIQHGNPASANCAALGGQLSIETLPRGGQFGVCLFEDNRQCEEWALMRGDCPVGGLKVTGYVTAAARYCAITGGKYAADPAGDAEHERGTCTLPDGTACDADAYYGGTCVAASR